MKPLALIALAALMSQAANYTATRATDGGFEVVRLTDAARRTEVSIVPSVGNTAYEMKVDGRNVLWMPSPNLAEWKSKALLGGVPFLAPWANRLDEDFFWANGKKYILNSGLGNLRRDPGNLPIHGLLAFTPLWQVAAVEADGDSARVTSRLDFWKYPDLMAQFPFAHSLEMTYRLADGQLEVATVVRNLADAPMPLAIGYHPYFQVPGAPREEWKAHVAAREHVILSEKLTPTGERRPVSLLDPAPLSSTRLDDVFTGLVRGADGKAEFWVEGRGTRISVVYGPKYPVAVVYAPPGREFICFEPMTAITNAFNLNQREMYPELQSVAAGGEWRESFWIRVSR
ncbi:MAG: aldose 1-epimerase [Bryobacteraceae bacterium]